MQGISTSFGETIYLLFDNNRMLKQMPFVHLNYIIDVTISIKNVMTTLFKSINNVTKCINVEFHLNRSNAYNPSHSKAYRTHKGRIAQ